MQSDPLHLEALVYDWQKLTFPAFESVKEENGARLHLIQTNKPGLCFFELVFRNGRWSEHKKLSARMAANQIMEGSAEVVAEKVADTLDYYGAHLSVHADLDFTVVSMSCLQKHFYYLSDFVVGLILFPAYREADLAKAKMFLHSQLQHQLTEPDYVSYREFTSHIYGADTVYGYNTEKSLIDAIQRDDLLRYQRENYCADFLELFYCGEVNEESRRFLKSLADRFPRSPAKEDIRHLLMPTGLAKAHFPIPHCSQISLKMGRRTFPKQHPDFYGFYVLNSILGDYFGSRLMRNIREDKGYTYDIHSSLDAQVHDGCFYISAELNPGQLEDSVHLIRQELEVLRGQLVPREELDMVRNYLCGHILRMMDGPFQTLAFLKILVTEYGGPAAFGELLNAILHIEAEDLRKLARHYLDPDDMVLITAGAGS